MLPSVMRPVRSLPSGIKKCITGRHLPHWLGRCLTTEASRLSEDLSKAFVTGPLTMLSEEEEMMKETGKFIVILQRSDVKTLYDVQSL